MPISVTKADLVSHVSAETGLKKSDAERALMAITQAIREALQTGKKVTLVGFGTFSVTARRARMGRDPQNPQREITIPASKVVRFKPGKAMKDAVNPLSSGTDTPLDPVSRTPGETDAHPIP